MIGLTAIFRNEAPYLEEWLNFHLAVGVDHFFLYNHQSTDNYQEVLASYVGARVVTLMEAPEVFSPQVPTYNHALTTHPECDWMVVCDLDEFIVPVSGNSLREVLARLDKPDASGIAVQWAVMLEDFETPPTGGVVRNYVHRLQTPYNAPNGISKVIVKPSRVTGMSDPHLAISRPGYRIYDELGRVVYMSQHFESESIQHLRVNHYWFKSKQEFAIKITRPSPNRDWADHDSYMANIWNLHDNVLAQPRIYDDTALRFTYAT